MVQDLPRADLLGPKIIFVLINIAIMGIALYKCNNLGLLPSIGDWVSFMTVKKVISKFETI